MSAKPKKDSAPPKKRESASWQAHFAFYLSIALAGFQIYQFVHAEAESKITASIEVVKKHLSDPDIGKGRYLAIKVIHGTAFSTFSDPEIDQWNRFILNVGYLAELLEKGRLDRAYLTQPIVCDIWLANAASKKLPGKNMFDVLNRLGAGLEQDCKPLYPP
jgi:hypothetical protein